MALVCDISSDQPNEDNPDIEDGEITDDDEEPTPQEPVPEPEPNPVSAGAQPTIPVIPKVQGNVSDSDSIGSVAKQMLDKIGDLSADGERVDEKDRFADGRERSRGKNREGKKARDRGIRDDKHRHMTEAERSILHLRKREKMARQREKWDKHHTRRDSDPLDDDFAKNIEKTLATILHKKEKEVAALSAGEELVEEEPRKGKKRKKEERDKERSKHKHKRMLMMADSPRPEDIDENEMLNIRSGSPGSDLRLMHGLPMGFPAIDQKRSRSPSLRSEDSYNSEPPVVEERIEERPRKRNSKNKKKKDIKRERREREQRRGNREEQARSLPQDSQGVCVFYLQGKCQKNDCPYSHEVSPPMKLELCKFYLMDCCAKGENCSYMHSEFPCKFYHTGLPCNAGADCKFAHGQPLSDGLKQILFKHIETAPRDILQGFPRLSRDEALNLINQTQKKLTDQYSESNTPSSSSSAVAASSTYTSTSSMTQNYNRPQQSPPPFTGFGMYRDEYTDPPPEREADVVKDIKTSERSMGKPSRWQQEPDDELSSSYHGKGFNYGTDQDMRYSSNGDIDMRTLPTIPSNSEISDIKRTSPKADVDIRNFTKDVDIRQPSFARNMDVDIRQQMLPFDATSQSDQDSSNSREGGFSNFDMPQSTKDLFARISANQKDNTVDSTGNHLDQQSSGHSHNNYDDQNINWYSDDDDDDENRLTIKVEEEDFQRKDRDDSASDRDAVDEERNEDSGEANRSFLSPPEISAKTADIVGKLGDLSKIDISAEVTKLLTSMSQNKPLPAQDSSASSTSAKMESGTSPRASDSAPTDPRIARQARSDSRPQDPRQDPRLNDPRQRSRQSSTETKDKEKKGGKMSIYEQGGIDMKSAALKIDNEELRNLRPDIDLRNMALPFKGMQNYTPATEIDASVNSHPPMTWKVYIVEIPRPDYTGLKLSINEAEKTGDPRLRKIFRLSVDEKDSPASPKASPKQSSGTRLDPRLRKMEEKTQESKDSLQTPQMSYSQQLSMLQSSQFYQSLTSNQKLMLNQELAKCDQSGGGGLHDPVLNNLLSNLNLLPQTSQVSNQMPPTSHMGAAATIISSIAKMSPMMPNQPIIGQQGLLGAAPGIPNIPPQGMPPDFPMNFDPRGAPGILGNGPPGPGYGQFGGMEQNHPYGNNYNDDYYGGGYDDQGNMGPQGGGMGGNFRHGGRGFNNNRDGRRRGNRDGFRGGRGNRHFHNKRGGGRDKMDRDRDRGRDGRGNRGHSPP